MRLNLPKPKDSFLNLPDIRTIYRELQVFQKAAMHQMVARNILSPTSFSMSELKFSEKGIPGKLDQAIRAYASENADRMAFIVKDLSAIPLDGPTGLFRRANLEMGGRFR